MSIIAPFNYNPANTYQGNGAASTYTVAINHHAFIKVTLSSAVLHQTTFRDNSANYTLGYAQNDVKTVSQQFILQDGDVVTFSVSAADSDTTIATIATQTDEMIVSMFINANLCFRVKSKISSISYGPSAVNLRSTIYSDITWHAEEFLHS